MSEINNMLAQYPSPDQRRRQTGAVMAEQFNRPTYHDQLPVERSSLFPVGEYPGGQIGFAFPAGVANAMLAPLRAYQGELGDYQDNRERFVDAGNAVASAAMTGGLLTARPAGSVGMGARISFKKGGPEEKFILENYAKMSLQELSDKLGYSIETVRREIQPILDSNNVKMRIPGSHFNAPEKLARNNTIAELYQNGESLKNIAARFGLNMQHVNTLLSKMPVVNRNRLAPRADQLIEFVIDRKNNMSYSEIARAWAEHSGESISRSKVAGILRDYGK